MTQYLNHFQDHNQNTSELDYDYYDSLFHAPLQMNGFHPNASKEDEDTLSPAYLHSLRPEYDLPMPSEWRSYENYAANIEADDVEYSDTTASTGIPQESSPTLYERSDDEINKASKKIKKISAQKTKRRRNAKLNEDLFNNGQRMIATKPLVIKQNKRTTEKQPPKLNQKKNGESNLIKNYVTKMIKFSLEFIDKPESLKLLHNKNEAGNIKDYLIQFQDEVHTLSLLRKIISITSEDSKSIRLCKRAIQEIFLIFLKFHAIKWIFNSEIKAEKRESHVQLRKRFIFISQNPENFNYLL